LLPLPYTPTAAHRQLAAYLKKLKGELPAQVRTRIVKGLQQHYLVRPKAISDGARTTARLLLVYALDVVVQLRRVPLLLEPATDEAPERRTPPPVATNCETLARARGISARAIRDHLQELLKIGFLTRKNNRGWQANFELYVAPEFVWAKPAQNAQEGPKKRSYAPLLPSEEATNFPPSIVQDKQDTRKVEIGQVEKLVTPSAPAGPGELTGNTGPQRAPQPAPPRPAPPCQASKAGAGGAAAAHVQAERLGWVTQAWHYAQKRLYPGRRFSEAEHEKAREALWYGTYRGFDLAATPAEWQRYHNEVLHRIDLVARYLERHPDKSLPSPYAEFVQGWPQPARLPAALPTLKSFTLSYLLMSYTRSAAVQKLIDSAETKLLIYFLDGNVRTQSNRPARNPRAVEIRRHERSIAKNAPFIKVALIYDLSDGHEIARFKKGQWL
jgi:hypothetical protein